MKPLFQFLMIISSIYIQFIQTRQELQELQPLKYQSNQLTSIQGIQQQAQLLDFDLQDQQKFIMSLFSKKRTLKSYGNQTPNLRSQDARLNQVDPEHQLSNNLTNQTIFEVFNITNYDELAEAFLQKAQKYKYYNPDTGMNETILIYNDTNHYNSTSGNIQKITLNDTVIIVNRTRTIQGFNKTIISFNSTQLNCSSNPSSKKSKEKNEKNSIYLVLINNPSSNYIEKQAEYELKPVELSNYDKINNSNVDHWQEDQLQQNSTYKSSNNMASLYQRQSINRDYNRTYEIVNDQSGIESNNTYKLQNNYQYDEQKYIQEGDNRKFNKLEQRDSFYQIYNNSGYTISENGTLRNSSYYNNYDSLEYINENEINGLEDKHYQRAVNESDSIYKSYQDLDNNSIYDSHQKTKLNKTIVNSKIEVDLYDFANTTSTNHNESLNNENKVNDESNNTITYQFNNTQEFQNWKEIPINTFLASELPKISKAIAQVNQQFQPYKNGYNFGKIENILQQGQDENLITLTFVNNQNDSQYYQVVFNKSQVKQCKKVYRDVS